MNKTTTKPTTKPAAAAPPFPAAPKESILGVSHEAPDTVDPLLVQILSWPRSHDSVGEREFCDHLRALLKSMGHTVTKHEVDAFSVSVPRQLTGPRAANDTERPSTTLFSCHVDTTDMALAPELRKKLNYDANFGLIALETDSVGGCLGADDGAGVWIMLRMIEAKVPGTYLFHRGEERGGISAKAIATHEQQWLKKFDAAVAFDRPRDDEIITHQGGMECASDAYAKHLCAELNKHGMGYKPSSKGVYTDTKEYRRLIPECINIGVGYTSQHGREETLDYAHLSALLKAACAIDWDTLTVDRDPSKVEAVPSWGLHSPSRPTYSSQRGWDWSDQFDPEPPKAKSKVKVKSAAPIQPTKPKVKAAAYVPAYTPEPDVLQELEGFGLEDIEYLCTEDTEVAARLVVSMAREIARLRADIAVLDSIYGPAQ